MMRETLATENNNGLVFSFIAHAVFLAFMILKTVFFASEPIDFQSAIRIDLVALPDKDLTAPTAAPAVPEPSPAMESPEPIKIEAKSAEPTLPEKKPVIDETAIKLSEAKKKDELLKKKEDDQKKKEALDKIKKLSAIESIKSSVETERIEKMVGQSESKPKAYKGNVLSPGTELTGISKIQHENYVTLIDRQIRENWTLPQWMSNKGFKAQALLKIDPNGAIVYNQIYKSSGNSNYDDIVLETITKSGPFPKPPEKLSALLAERGVLIGFPE